MADKTYLEKLAESDRDMRTKRMLAKLYKHIAKREYKRSHRFYRTEDRLKHSLVDCERYRSDADGEGWTYYGYLIGEDFTGYYDVETTFDLTDEEIEDWIQTHIRYAIHSPYDCTGREFTRWVNWHRNPSGMISYVHKTALDV